MQRLLDVDSLSQILDFAGISVWEVDTEGCYTFNSPNSEKLYGFSPADLQGKKLFDYIPKEKGLVWQLAERGFYNHESIDRLVLQWYHKNGQVLYLETSAAPLYTKDGTWIGYRGISRDVTEKTIHENGREDAFQQTISILKSLDSAVYIIDLDTHELLFLNSRAHKKKGTDSLGKKCFEVLENQKDPCSFCTIDQLLANKDNPDFVLKWDHQNLTTGRWHHTINRLIKWTNGKVVSLEMVTDITETKETQIKLQEEQEKFAKLFHSSPYGILLTRRSDYAIISVNQAFERLMGVPREEITGSSVQKIMDSLMFAPDGPAFHEQIINGNPIINQEIQFHNANNKELTCLLSVTTIILGNEPHYITSLNNITERKIVEQSLFESESRLQNVLDSQTGYVIRTDLKGQITYFNKKYHSDFGVKPGNKLLMALDSIANYHHDSARMTVNNCIVNPGKTFQIELDKIDNSGKTRTTLWDFTYIKGSAINPGEIQCVGIDITGRRAAENELKVRDIQFQTLFQTMEEGAIYHDPFGKIVAINPTAQKILGITQEALKSGLYDFNRSRKHFNEEGQPMEPQDHPAMVAARTGKRAAQIIGFLDEESNKTRWIQAKSIPEYLPGDQNPFRILTTITDITKLQENLQAEQKLSQSLKEDVVRIDQEFSRLSHLHQTILENAGLAILFADPDGIIQYINPAMERMTGYAQHEFISKKIHVSCLTDPAEIVSISEKLTGKPNLTNHEVREALDIYMEGQTTEWTLITKHKATLPVKVNLSLLKNDEGGLLGGIFIYMDISNEKEILQTLRESEARFTRMFMDHDAIMLLIDPATLEIIKANESAKTFYGYNFEEESKIKINQLNQIPTEDLQNKMQAALTLVNQCFIFKHTLHNGEVRIVEVHSSPIETNDKTVLFSIIHDVTDRETIREQLSESEARWNFALEGAGEGVWDWNMSTGEVFYSDQWKKLLGYEKNEINGDLSEWETRIHPADLEICMSNLREHIFGNTEHYFNEHRAITKNGTTIWVLDRGKVIQRLKDGTPVRMICATKDITSQKILEKTLVDTIEKEKELNTLKSRFISMASHEFRTPLATIMASSESVSSYWGKMTSEQREGKHHKIREQVMRLSQFVEKMLQLSKLQNSEHLIDIEHFELNEFLHKVTEDIKLLVNGTHQIILDLPGDELWINSDRNALTMIINNLLTNSIKYSAPGTEIIIDLAKVDNQYLISITDQGVGIPEQEQKHLFTPFFRASNSGHVSGTGLGLNIVKENTEKLGGTINLTSKINKGTAVTITIPINPEPSAEKLKLTYEEDSHR